MTKKFTQEELEAAYEQMKEDREEDYNRAKRAIEWLVKQHTVFHGNSVYLRAPVHTPCWHPHITPETDKFEIVLEYSLYGTSIKIYTDFLEKQTWVKKIRVDRPVYEISTPEGTYKVVFSEFDHGNW